MAPKIDMRTQIRIQLRDASGDENDGNLAVYSFFFFADREEVAVLKKEQ